MSTNNSFSGIIAHYASRLPVSESMKPVSLGEGGTPLIKLRNIPRLVGKDVELYVKYEGLNPTGSFKDRGMTLAVTKAVEEGSEAIICASTGNTSAAAAAYAARAGITAFVLIPDGKIALGKLAQTLMYGAVVIQIRGNFDDGMRLVKEVAGKAPVTIVNSINPYRIEGQKTAAFEIIDQLGSAPDFHCLPVGNAGNITAYWKGYSEYASESQGHPAVTSSCPIMAGYQAAGSAPFVIGGIVDHPETVATAIRIGHPQSWDLAWLAQKESGGWFDKVEDDEILRVQKMLAEKEGVFCEPASAASLAGALHDIESGKIPEESSIVCTLTGNGLKDPDTAIKQCHIQPVTIEPELDSVKRVILDRL